MTAITNLNYESQVLNEIKQIPIEHLPSFLKIVQAYRESVTLPSAVDSFRQGWLDIQAGNTHPIETLWDGIDVD